MAMIFPGMDPYLEDPQIWPEVHTSMIVYVRDCLQPLIEPRYIASIGVRVFLEGPEPGQRIPDVFVKERRPPQARGTTATIDADAPQIVTVRQQEIRQPFIEIIDKRTKDRIVTVLELLSPTNKTKGPGRTSYLEKQKEVLESDSHLVEIDLLRTGRHTLSVPKRATAKCRPYYYLVCINRAQGRREQFELYARRLPERLPRVSIPLAGDDADVTLDLQALLAQTYEACRFRARLHYSLPCKPYLEPDDQAWADQLIRAATPAMP